MSVFKQRGFIRILRYAVIAAFALLLLVSLSRAEEAVQAPNQATEAQRSLQDSSDHIDHDSMGHSQMGSGQNGAGQSDVDQTDFDATDNAGHSIHIDAKNREGSVLPPNDCSVPDMSGHVHPTPAPDSVEAGVTEHLGEPITTPIYFTDSTGKRVDIRSLMTSPVLIAPVYCSCPGVCHILMSSIAGVLPSVRLTPNEDYRIITASFDELDTPELAAKKKKNFMHALHAADPSFRRMHGNFLLAINKALMR